MNRSHLDAVLFSPVPSELAWASLGFHAAYAGLRPCEHATLEKTTTFPIRSLETRRPLSSFDCIFVSIAWELELPDLVKALLCSGIEPDRALRPETQPLIVAGGPLTLSNPEALSAICDAIFVGEADCSFSALRLALAEARDRSDALERLSRIEGVLVPALVGEDREAPPYVQAPLSALPATSTVLSTRNLFGNAFLIEANRGCPRSCTFCVVRCPRRRPTFVPVETIVSRVPSGVARVGLVGAAVSDHPRIHEILDRLVSKGISVTLSSVRADRVDPELARLLRLGGLKTLTIGVDGPSESLRRTVRKGLTEEEVISCAKAAKEAAFTALRLYLMVGLPGEDDGDMEEAASLIRKVSSLLPVTVSVSPFVPKRFTPLAEAPFAGISLLKRRLALLRKGVGGGAKISFSSPRLAEREWRLSHARGREALELCLRFLEEKGV